MIIFAQVSRERYDNYLGLLGCAFRDGMSHYHYVAMCALCMEADKFTLTETIQ